MNQTQIIAQAQTILNHVLSNLPSFTGDFLVIFVLVGFLFLFARYTGRGQFVALIISLYSGYAMYSIFPFMGYLPSAPAITALASDLAVYGVLSGIAYVILRRIVVSDFLSIGIIGVAILSVLGAGLLMSLAYNVFPVQNVYTFTPAVDLLFAPKEYFFWWFVAPLIGLFVFAR